MIFVDTNVFLDMVEAGEGPAAAWAKAALGRVAGASALVSNLIVAAEVAGQSNSVDLLGDSFAAVEIELIDLDLASAYRAGKAFREYRRRGGDRSTILPDFLIGAHAETLGATLLTRDRGIASYFPDLALITPETHPNG